MLSRLDFGLVARLADNIPALKPKILLQLKTNIAKELEIIAAKLFDNLQSTMTTLCFAICKFTLKIIQINTLTPEHSLFVDIEVDSC